MLSKEYEIFFKEHYRALSLYALKYSNDIEVAEDIVQDCLLKLWEDWKKKRELENLVGYTYLMVRNRCINYARDKKACDTLDICDQKELSTTDVDHYIEQEAFRHFYAAIEKLPKSVHEVVNLTLAGYSLEEIAEKRTSSVATIKKQRQIAKQMLRERLHYLHFFFQLLKKYKDS